MSSLIANFDKLNRLAVIVAGSAMLVMVLQVSLDILCKYLFNYPIPSTLETVSSYYMVAIVFLPLGMVTREHEHISVELFTQTAGKKALSIINALAGVLAIIYVAALVIYSGAKALHMTEIRESWETAIWDMEVWPSRWFLTVGCAMMLFYLIVQTVDNFTFFFTGRKVLNDDE
ncbi:unnamed protein product, partial [Discosporangium mesarthrocarpum]